MYLFLEEPRLVLLKYEDISSCEPLWPLTSVLPSSGQQHGKHQGSLREHRQAEGGGGPAAGRGGAGAPPRQGAAGAGGGAAESGAAAVPRPRSQSQPHSPSPACRRAPGGFWEPQPATSWTFPASDFLFPPAELSERSCEWRAAVRGDAGLLQAAGPVPEPWRCRGSSRWRFAFSTD